MGRKCAVPHCYTGYRKCKEKASLYRVPDDDYFLGKWQEAIAREDRPITPKDYVCEKHFKDDDILRRRIIKDVVEEYQRPRLKPDAIPSIFPDLPEFILKMVKKRRKMPIENQDEIEITDASEQPEATENQHMIEEVKIEPIDTNNEIDIKSEPEENIVDPIENGEEDNEKEDPSFGPNKHNCDQCPYSTKYAHNLRTHKTKHLTGDDAYLHCEFCPDYKTKWELTFRNHMKIKHKIGKQEIFKCNLCQFQTRVKQCLKRHNDGHDRGIFDKNWSCTFPGCDFKDKSKAFLELHSLLHKQLDATQESTEKQKLFKCTECLYETNSKTHIIQHIKSAHNTGDDTIVSVTNKRTRSDKLKNGPSDKSRYKCLKCPYKTGSEANLRKHVQKHENPDSIQSELKAKIWKCPKCPYATFFQHALQRHRQMECRDVHLCPDCNYKSCSRADYIKHTLTHTNSSLENVYQNGSASETVANNIKQNGRHFQENYDDNEFVDCLRTMQDQVKQENSPVDSPVDPSVNVHDFVLVSVKEEVHETD